MQVDPAVRLEGTPPFLNKEYLQLKKDMSLTANGISINTALMIGSFMLEKSILCPYVIEVLFSNGKSAVETRKSMYLLAIVLSFMSIDGSINITYSLRLPR